MYLFVLSIFLPALNRDHCDDDYVGFTCDDLTKGIEYVQNNLLTRARTKQISIQTKIKSDADHLFNRLITLSYALATDSIPIFSESSIKTKPDIAIEMATNTEAKNDIQTCELLTELPNQTNYYNVNSTATSILLSPTLNKLFDKIGPASLHILIHLSLNLTEKINHTNYAVFQGSKMPQNCGNLAGTIIPNRCSFDQLINAASASNFIHMLANTHGWMVNLIRGTSPFLYDNIGKACWRAKSFLAGGINPIYPGTGRSILDISRSNLECSNTTITKKYLKVLL